jgi:hypothetical protein
MNYRDIISSASTKSPGVGATATNSQIFTIAGPTGATGPQGPTGSGGGGTGSTIIESDTVPGTTASMTLWFNTAAGTLNICYQGVYIEV